MRVALYQGKSFVSLAIRFLTRSSYSHAAFLFDKEAKAAAQRLAGAGHKLGGLHFWHDGAVVEAWQGGVQNNLSLSTLHTSGTKVDLFELATGLAPKQEEALVAFCADIIGWPYGFLNVFRFITKIPGRDDGSYFCSEAVFEGFRKVGVTLLERKADWEVPPDWLQMSPKLRFTGSVLTR